MREFWKIWVSENLYSRIFGAMSECILACRLLIKENNTFWEENLNESKPDDIIHKLLNEIFPYSNEI